jgi:hypothetical protein
MISFDMSSMAMPPSDSVEGSAITSLLRYAPRRTSVPALSTPSRSAETSTGSASVESELKRFDWLDLHYSQIPHSIGLRSAGPRGGRTPRGSLQTLGGLADGYLPTTAEGVASAATFASGFMPSPYSGIAGGLAGAALLANGGPGAAKFAQAPSRNRADAFSFANIASGLLTMYSAMPLPQWRGMTAVSSGLTAIGAMPGLYRTRAARSGAVRALNGLSSMGYVLNAALAIEAARNTDAGEHASAANYTHAANAAWIAAWILSNLAGHLESRSGEQEVSPNSGDAVRLLGPDNV